jgi:putative ABC transport system permease protein
VVADQHDAPRPRRGSWTVRTLFGLQSAVEGLLSHKLRSSLTALGVVVGVASLIALLAIGNGARAAIARQFESLGSNLIKVETHRWDIRLQTKDAEELVERVPTVIAAMPVTQNEEVQVKYRRLVKMMSVTGVSANFPEVRDHEILAGRFFSPIHVQERMRVAVLGYDAWRTLFGTTDPTGEGVYLNGQRFTVMGVLERKGEGMADDIDKRIVVPVTSAQRIALSGRVHELWLKAPSAPAVEAAMVQVGRILRHQFNLEDPSEEDGQVVPGMDRAIYREVGKSGGYVGMEPYPYYDPTRQQSDGPPLTVTSLNTMVEEASEASRVMTMMLGGVASVALLVGGLGIMNIMLVSVSERTREIGIRKALGAHPLDLTSQFMAEALILCVTGALLGIGAGYVATEVASRYGIETLFLTQSALAAFLAAVGVGVLFGAYPAYCAAQLEPVEALRHQQ